MFTSRAEYRLRLRQDNADFRLTPLGRELGLVDDERWRVFSNRKRDIESGGKRLAGLVAAPGSDLALAVEAACGERIAASISLYDLLKRPNVTATALADALAAASPGTATGAREGFDPSVLEQLEIEAKYAGYMSRQDDEIARVKANERLALAEDFDYQCISGLSNELKEKLRARRPASIAQAARVPGVTPAALSLLLVHAKRKSGERRRA